MSYSRDTISRVPYFDHTLRRVPVSLCLELRHISLPRRAYHCALRDKERRERRRRGGSPTRLAAFLAALVAAFRAAFRGSRRGGAIDDLVVTVLTRVLRRRFALPPSDRGGRAPRAGVLLSGLGLELGLGVGSRSSGWRASIRGRGRGGVRARVALLGLACFC